MAALSDRSWLSGRWAGILKRRTVCKTERLRKVDEFSRRVYQETGGATPELKNLLTEYLEKKKT